MFVLLFLVLSNHRVKAQSNFIDSIRNMLLDLDEQIQYAPINQLLTQAIPYCTGDSINDSLAVFLKDFFSEEYFFKGGMLQPVSPHLLQKYKLFIRRVVYYYRDSVPGIDYEEKLMMIAIADKWLPPVNREHPISKVKDVLLRMHFAQPFLQAKHLYYLALLYVQDKPDSASFFFQKAIAKNPNSTGLEKNFYKETLHRYGEFLRGKNKPDSALLLFNELLNEVKRTEEMNSAAYAYWLIVLANSYIYMSKYDLALQLDFEAMEITENTIGKETNQYALCITEIGEIYYRTGEYEKSLRYTQEALNLKRKIFGDGYFDNVVNLHDLATLYTRMGLYKEAIPLFNESLGISKKYYGEDVVYAFDLHPLAEVYEDMGEYDKALPLYQKALMIQTQIGKANYYYPRTLHSLGSLYIKLGQYDKAIDLFKQSLQLKEQVFGRLNTEYAKTLNSYVIACLQKGDFDKALSLQQESLDIYKKLFGAIHPNIASGLYNFATLYYLEDKPVKAVEFCNNALQLQIKLLGQNHQDVARSYDLLGDINKGLNQNKTAREYYLTAFDIRKKSMNAIHPGYVQSLYNLATIHIKEGSMVEATKLLMNADSASLAHIKESYGSLSEEQKLVYLRNRERHFQYLPSLLYLHKISSPEIVNRVYSDAITLKSMVLFHQQNVYNNIRKSGDSAALQLYDQWRLNKGLMGQEILLPPGKRLSNFDSLADITAQLEGRLSYISSTFRSNLLYNSADGNAIMQALSKNEAAVEFIRFRLYNKQWTDSIMYAAIVLLPGANNTVFVPLFEESELKKLLQFSNNRGKAAVSYLYPSVDTETAVSDKLYKLIWQPLQAVLGNTHKVYYSPCGLLYGISFAALHAGNKEVLIEKYHLQQLVCTRSLAFPAEEKNGFTSASLWGGINYNVSLTLPLKKPGATHTSSATSVKASHKLNYLNKTYAPAAWQQLPGTKKETEQILQVLNENNITSELKADTAASEKAFKKMDGRAPALIHIATHGFFLQAANAVKTSQNFLSASNSFTQQQDPMLRSGLILSGANVMWTGNLPSPGLEDGVLTAYEISQLDLSNTQLVTLSACETALGDIKDNEGVYGLQRAFKMAGVQQIVMSLWKIPDEQTNQLMQLFYNAMLQGDDANTALRTAQLAMKQKYPPYYWAGFVLLE